MKKLTITLLLLPYFLLANDAQIHSKIKEVTVYLSGAQIERNAHFYLKEGTSKVTFTGLSHKIDESSIQVSGLQFVSILSMDFDINYLEKSENNPQIKQLEDGMEAVQFKIAGLQNLISGLEEEKELIHKNRIVSGDNQALDLEAFKKISSYYRQRITEIKNRIFKTNKEIGVLKLDIQAIRNQLIEINNTPEQPQGEITITFDAPIATDLDISLSYLVSDAGWIPNYDIKSEGVNDPLRLAYKAHVYQKTGQDWNDINVVLSTGNPNYNISKPVLETKYLNFVSAYSKRHRSSVKKKGYAYNPTVKKVMGTVTDQSGEPLPGVNVIVHGSSNGTTTDFDGNYVLNVANGSKLEFSYIGQKSEIIPIYSSIINVRMEEDAMALEEVVVTAMGTKKQKSYTGAVASISPERLLQGRAAGVKIRGISSNNGRVSRVPIIHPPLYIIDGVPIENFEEGDLDENEIQNIEVLKDEAASAIYGSRSANGVVIITTKKSTLQDDLTNTKFIIKKPYSIVSDGDITAIEINTFKMPAEYEYLAAPVINENVFLTASFKDWEKYRLLPGEANIYFEGTYAGKTTLDPYTVKKEMVLSLGIDPNITVTRKQQRNFKSKSFTGSNRILNRTYDLEVKNNKNIAVALKLMDRIPKSQHKDIKVDDIEIFEATYDKKKGLLSWEFNLKPKETKKESFSFQVKYPRGRYISL